MRTFVLLFPGLLIACVPPLTVREATLPDDGVVLGDPSDVPAPEDPADTEGPDTDRPEDSDGDSDVLPAGPCPVDMVLVDETFCIDVTEAALEAFSGTAWVEHSPYLPVGDEAVRAVSGRGKVPQAHISGDEAEAACEASGKRLCTSAEWLSACEGPDAHTYPYGDVSVAGACNDTYPGGHPVVDLFGTNVGVWDPVSMNDARINQQADTVDAGAANPQCVSDWGAYDLHGNLHEWVSDAAGTFRGGFYADAVINGTGCGYRTTAHGRGYHDYSTGFRCCAEPSGE